MTIFEASKLFIRRCRHECQLSANTISAYEQDLAEFTKFVGASRGVLTVSPREIVAFRRHLQGSRRLAPATVKRRISCIRTMYAWLKRWQKMESPFENLDLRVRLPERLPRCLRTSDVVRLARHLDSLGPDVALAVGLLLATGMRVGELVALRLADVDPTAGVLRVIGKGSRERAVFIFNDDLRRRLSERVARQRSPQRRLIYTSQRRPATASYIRRSLARLASVAGIRQRVTPHMLRHTAATMLLETGIDIRLIQKLLGHRSIVTTEIYTHVADTVLRRELARADVLNRVTSIAES